MLGQTLTFSVDKNNKITFGDYYEWFIVTELLYYTQFL